MTNGAEKPKDCVAPGGITKSVAVARLVRLARKAGLDYDGLLYVCQQARRKLGLRKPTRQRRLPQLLTESELHRFFQAIERCGDVQHEILLKLLFYTAIRVGELAHIKVGELAHIKVGELAHIKVADVDLDGCRIFIDHGKGDKDRYILFPTSFRLVLKSHLGAHPRNLFLFESQRRGPFTPRRIQQIVQAYRTRAGLTTAVHPHLFRHQMLTFLTAHGLTDAQIQLISGHGSKKSLEVYQHLSLQRVAPDYQKALQTVGI